MFKYADFAIRTVNALCGLHLPLTGIALPIGISFFTFQGLSYVIDVYREPQTVSHSFKKVLLYIAFFPQLIAGPIVKYHDVEQEIDSRRTTPQETALGIRRFICGLSKKLLLSNALGQMADTVFALPVGEIGMLAGWTGAICYTLQIYFDFSGYSDMAIGLGRMFGFHFRENFNYPYTATTIKEFWRRWHISLSGWFRDYLYFPLGGSRGSSGRTAVNLMITFLVSGLWHGAGWHYVVWGAIHGSYQVAGRGIRYVSEAAQKRLPEKKIRFFSEKMQGLTRAARICVTFILTDFAWLFFRADHLGRAVAMLRRVVQNGNWLGQFTDGTLFGMGLCRLEVYQLAFTIGVLLVLDILHESGISIRAWLAKQVFVIRWSIYMLVLLGFVVLLLQNYGRAAAEFLYFQF